jgi:FkbM family methyltransferase
MQPQSYSQFGQDKLIASLFDHKRGGTFIEIGAFDGETFSNTAMLERSYGWRGICVEPLPSAFAALRKSRTAISVNAAAGASDGKLRFEEIDGYGAMLSGSADTRPPAHNARVVREQQHHGFERRMIEVDKVRAADLLRKHGMPTVDFASIDVEGAEMECLKGLLDPDITVRAIAIENNYGEREVADFLSERGYVRLTTAGEDDIFKLQSELGLRDYLMLLLATPRRWKRDRKRRRNARKL